MKPLIYSNNDEKNWGIWQKQHAWDMNKHFKERLFSFNAIKVDRHFVIENTPTQF